MHLSTVLTSLFLAPLLCLATGPSYINQPKNGTHVAPGASFPFDYHALGDYCQSSYNFTVYLFTTKPTSFSPSQTWATGHYYGRYSIENYPGNPFPTNPPPSRLVMPDFSKSPGGFGAGKKASNQKVYLTVLEETGICEEALGVVFALEWAELVYNATSK